MRVKYSENQLHAHRCFTSKEDYNIHVYDYYNGDFEAAYEEFAKGPDAPQCCQNDFREYNFIDEGAEPPADGRDVSVQNSSYEFLRWIVGMQS
eukprot:3708303-Pleurochrysis_carterae.AAC.2